MDNKYQNGKIYKIVDSGYTKCYIGSTVEPLSNRMAGHRSHYRRGKLNSNSKLLFDEFGTDNCRIELIEHFPCNSKEELLKREGNYISSTDCVNKVVPGRTKQEWHQQRYNLPHVVAYRKQFVETHCEELKEYKKNWGAHLFLCECGCEINRSSKSKHLKSIKHNELMSDIGSR